MNSWGTFGCSEDADEKEEDEDEEDESDEDEEQREDEEATTKKQVAEDKLPSLSTYSQSPAGPPNQKPERQGVQILQQMDILEEPAVWSRG